MGFPHFLQGAAMPPYDVVSHSLRGMSGTMFDMFRQPDKLIKRKSLELFEILIVNSPKFANERTRDAIIGRCSDLNRGVRRIAINLYKQLLNSAPHLLDQKGVNEILNRLGDLDRNIRSKAFEMYKFFLERAPHLIDCDKARKSLEKHSDLNQENEVIRWGL